MNAIRVYILCVICTVFLCGIMQALFAESAISGVVKFITGLIVTVSLLSPALTGKIESLDHYFESITVDGEWAVKQGETDAKETMRKYVAEEIKSYIMNKAIELGVEISVDVELSADTYPTPETVTISGSIAPFGKKQISAYLSETLGITEEQQVWIS